MPARGARARHHPPRSQAGEHLPLPEPLARPARREGARLRRDEDGRRGERHPEELAHADRLHRGHALLHEPRAAPQLVRGRRAGRRLLARRRALRVPLRPQALPGRHHRRPRVRPLLGPAHPALSHPARPLRRRGRSGDADAERQPRRPPREHARPRARAAAPREPGVLALGQGRREAAGARARRPAGRHRTRRRPRAAPRGARSPWASRPGPCPRPGPAAPGRARARAHRSEAPGQRGAARHAHGDVRQGRARRRGVGRGRSRHADARHLARRDPPPRCARRAARGREHPRHARRRGSPAAELRIAAGGAAAVLVVRVGRRDGRRADDAGTAGRASRRAPARRERREPDDAPGRVPARGSLVRGAETPQTPRAPSWERRRSRRGK